MECFVIQPVNSINNNFGDFLAAQLSYFVKVCKKIIPWMLQSKQFHVKAMKNFQTLTKHALFKELCFKKLYYSKQTQRFMQGLNRALVVIVMASSGNHADSETFITGAPSSVIMP